MLSINSIEDFGGIGEEDYLRIDYIDILTDCDWNDDLNKIFNCVNVSVISLSFGCNMEGPRSIPFDNFAIFQKLNSLHISYITQFADWWIDYDVPCVCSCENNVLILKTSVNDNDIINSNTAINLNILSGYNEYLFNNLPPQLKKIRLCDYGPKKLVIKNLPISLEELTVVTFKNVDLVNNVDINIKVPHGCKLNIIDK